MATNPPPGPGRVGAVRNRAQVYSPQNKRWTKIDKKNRNRFIDQHAKKNSPFKGVTKKGKRTGKKGR